MAQGPLTPVGSSFKELLSKLIDAATTLVPHSDYHPLSYVGQKAGLSIPEMKRIATALCSPLSDARDTLKAHGIDFLSTGGVPKNLSQSFVCTKETASRWVAPRTNPDLTEIDYRPMTDAEYLEATQGIDITRRNFNQQQETKQ